MFGKLMKYELRDCLRIFLPLWGAILVIALINGLTEGIGLSVSGRLMEFILHILPALLLFALSFGMFVIALIIIIRRFYSGLLGEGGYLAFSLPVNAAQHITAKFFTSLIMIVGCVLTGFFASVILMAARGYLGSAREFLEKTGKFLSLYPKTGILAAELVLILLLITSYTVLRLYSGIAVGHLFNSHRGLWSVIAVIGIGWILNAASIWISRLFRFFGNSPSIEINVNSFLDLLRYLNLLQGVFGIVIGFLIAGNVVLWLATWLILKKRLNIL